MPLGFIGTTDISMDGLVSNSSDPIVDSALGPLQELSSITGQVTDFEPAAAQTRILRLSPAQIPPKCGLDSEE
jgi:hypothetical protein